MAEAKVFVTDAHPDGIPNQKTGTIITAALHIFCAIVGAGVLSLPHSMAQLGWVAGPIMIILFYVVSTLTAQYVGCLLTEVYEVNGVEHPRYHIAVDNILGKWYSLACTVCQLLNLVLVDIAYTISAATSMKQIATLACEYNGNEDDCWSSTWKMTLIFGACEVPLSMVPNLEALWWVSAIGVATSLTYSTMGMGLSLHYAPNRLGTVGGISASHPAKAFGVLNALGAIAFAYAFHLLLLEIQDTLRQPPKAEKTMKPASAFGIGLSFFYYFIISVAGYAALGNDAPGFLFVAFPSAPRWLMIIGNLCILLHMLSAFQVFGQPVFDSIESHFKAFQLKRKGSPKDAESLEAKLPEKGDSVDEPAANAGPPALARTSRLSDGVAKLHRASAMYRVSTGFANPNVPSNDEYVLPLWQRFIIRTSYVIAITVISCCLPFFSDMAGLIGAVTFWPLSVFFPIRLWRTIHKPSGWFSHLLHFIEWGMLLVALAATVGAIRGIIISSQNYTVFGD